MLVFSVPSKAQNNGIGVLISREIRPYVQMVEGLELQLNMPVHRFFLDDSGRPYSLGPGQLEIQSKKFAAMVAVGPQALTYLFSRKSVSPLLYGMVLNPGQITGDIEVCGISLNISPQEQLAVILQSMPHVRRLGVLFDPANNQYWFDQARQIAEESTVALVPLLVDRQSSRTNFIDVKFRLDAVLFIPDKTVISKIMIQHVIKQALLQKIPVIGYNRFFYESGAAMSFSFNYRKVGELVAAQVGSLLAGEGCHPIDEPAYKLEFNRDMFERLDIPYPATTE